jgi:hypothetical protein
VQDHINGKQYVGWSKIRDKLKELEPSFGPASRAAHEPRAEFRDRGAQDRDGDFRRGLSAERGRRNGDDRYGDRGNSRGGRGSYGDRLNYDDRGSYDRGYDRDRGRAYDRSYDRDAQEDRYGGYDRGYDRGFGRRGDEHHGGDRHARDSRGYRGHGGDRYGDRGYGRPARDGV